MKDSFSPADQFDGKVAPSSEGPQKIDEVLLFLRGQPIEMLDDPI
jgi:hypothetical protein